MKEGVIEVVKNIMNRKCINCEEGIEERHRLPLCAACRLEYISEVFDK